MFLASGALAVGIQNTALGVGEINAALKIHKEAFCQDKRLFYAEYCEGVAHHNEEFAQVQRLHSQGFALDDAAYKQADRHHRREFQQAKLQHRINIDIAMRSEIRNGLRDEFYQKLNRYNALLVCQTVMLAISFQQAVVTDLPGKTWATWLYIYSAVLGLAFGNITLAMWCNFLVTRRLNEYTAGVMHIEMHLSEEWRRKRGHDDVLDVALLRDYFRRWFSRHCGLLAGASMHLFWTGVILLFAAAAIGLYVRVELRNKVHLGVIPFFIVLCFITVSVVGVEIKEERVHKNKQGVYGRHWVGKLSSSLRDQIGDLLRFEMITLPDSAFEQYVPNAGIEMLLAQVPTLSSLSQSTRIRLAGRLELKIFSNDDVIVTEGESGDCMYIVDDGEVVVHIGGHGEVARLNRGQYFGEVALIKDVPRTATIRAAGDVTCLKLNRTAFNELVPDVVEDQRGEALQTVTNASEEQELHTASAEEAGSRRLCQDVEILDQTRDMCANAAKSEVLLEKAWRMCQENEQKERDMKNEDWERDDWLSSMLTDV